MFHASLVILLSQMYYFLREGKIVLPLQQTVLSDGSVSNTNLYSFPIQVCYEIGYIKEITLPDFL